MSWKIIKSKTIIKDKWIDVRADDCEMPGGKIIKPYYILNYPDYVNALAVTTENKIILNRQYRHGTQQTKLELPSGTVDEGETPLEAIARELKEETGYVFRKIILTGKVCPNPANHSNFAYSYLAVGGIKKSKQQLDESENIVNLLVSKNKLLQMLENNEFDNSMHVASIYYGLKKLNNL